MQTKNFAIPLMSQNQCSKDITFNTAMSIVDVLLKNSATAVISSPPSTPNDGDVYIVSTSPAGIFASYSNALAIYLQSQGWILTNPVSGFTIFVVSVNQTMEFNGSIWKQNGIPSMVLASTQSVGGVKIGSGISIASDGTISASIPTFATVATSGSYSDLTNKPSIPASQVHSDWNAASGIAQILNKPAIPTVGTSASQNIVNGLFYIGDFKYSAQTTSHGGVNNTWWLLCNGSAISRSTYNLLN